MYFKINQLTLFSVSCREFDSVHGQGLSAEPKSVWEVMTRDPGTIIINLFFGCTSCKLMLWLGAGGNGASDNVNDLNYFMNLI